MQADITRQTTNVKKLTEDLKLLRVKNERLQDQLDAANATNSALREELAAKETEVTILQDDNDEKEQTLEAAKQTIEDLVNGQEPLELPED